MPTPRSCACATVYERDFESEAVLFKAIADPHRLTIVATLARSSEPVCVCDFTAALPMNQSSVSHHLGLLRDAGLVVSERRGTWAYYSLVPGIKERLLAALDEALPRSATLTKAS